MLINALYAFCLWVLYKTPDNGQALARGLLGFRPHHGGRLFVQRLFWLRNFWLQIRLRVVGAERAADFLGAARHFEAGGWQLCDPLIFPKTC